MTSSFLRLTLCALLYTLCFVSDASARHEVEDSERVRLLQTATGETAASSSFQGRMDATFNPASDAATATVARQDTAERERFEAAQVLEEFSVTAEEIPEKALASQKGLDQSKVDATEKTYLKELEKLMVPVPAQKGMGELEEFLKQPEAAQPRSNLRPSLANNPFYFSPEAAEQFEDKKSVIVSRLTQQGYSQREAETLVGDATSSEEVILTLMQDEDYEYGDAAAIASVS